MTVTVESPEEVEDLVERASRGDRAAFDDLFVLHRPALLRSLAFRLQDSRREIDLEDLLQETFLRAFQSIGKFRWQGKGSFQRWLQGIGGNVVMKELGLHRRRNELKLEQDLPAREVSPLTRLRREERWERLQKALQGLSPDHRKVILLARIEKVPIREIARLMNRSPDAVSHLLMRAVEKLKRSLGDVESPYLPDRRLEEGGGRS